MEKAMRHHTLHAVIGILCILAAFSTPDGGVTAAPPAAGVGRPPLPGKIAPVPGRRVLADFRTAYNLPAGRTERGLAYARGVRTVTVMKGGAAVPSQVHRVTVDSIITQCGLTVRDTWDAHYYRLETEWIFDRIELRGSKEIGTPKKKLPALEDGKALSLVRQGLGERRPGWDVKEVVLLKKSASREGCTARALVTTRALLSRKDDITNTVSTYECLMRSTLENPGGEWRYAGDACVFRGKDRADCFIPTMCRNLSSAGSLPEVNDGEALQLLKISLEKEYGLMMGNVEIEALELLSRGEPEAYRTKIPLTARVLFSIDELKEAATAGGKQALVKSRPVYECVVRAFLIYSKERTRWHVSLESCCSDEASRCGYPCSEPGKGCTRIGEK
jgi:hypothetical protein